MLTSQQSLRAMNTKGNRMRRYLVCCVLVVSTAIGARADIPVETPHTEILADHAGKGWFWVWGIGAPTILDGRDYLFDASGKQLGLLSTGAYAGALLHSVKRDELLSVETYFSRGSRGERIDVITVYDPKTLLVKREIRIPPKRAVALGYVGLAVMSDDERFLLVQNFTPAQTISIVDLEASKFVAEVETPGCASIYAAGERDFYSTCGDGGFFHLRLDNDGHAILRERIAPVFDPINDFLTTEASRLGNSWYFVSQQNNVYELEMSPSGVKLAGKWSLVTDGERKKNWRISGDENTAIHRRSGRLFVLMHQGGPETRPDPATEIWVYDLKTHLRVSSIDLKELTVSMAVTQDAEPRVYTVDLIVPMPYLAKLWVYLTEGQDGIVKVMRNGVGIYDGNSGKQLREIDGMAGGLLTAVLPW
jgi:methylamine dehydrogenase heavy chain